MDNKIKSLVKKLTRFGYQVKPNVIWPPRHNLKIFEFSRCQFIHAPRTNARAHLFNVGHQRHWSEKFLTTPTWASIMTPSSRN